MNSKDYSVKMAFPKLSSQMEDHNSDPNSETLHKSGDSSISNPHHTTINQMEKQKDLLGLSRTPSPKHIRVVKTQTWHYCATDQQIQSVIRTLMARNTSETAYTSSPTQMSQEDLKGQSGNQADTRTITHRLWIHQS